MALGAGLLLGNRGRSAFAVLQDLATGAMDSATDGPDGNSGRLWSGHAKLTDELGRIGLYDEKERARFCLRGKALPILLGALSCAVAASASSVNPQVVIAAGLLGLSLGYMAHRSSYRRMRTGHLRRIEFYLPVVMERLVMAVQAGLDVVPAVNALLELSGAENAGSPEKWDPVSRLLGFVRDLTESGLGFEKALKEVASCVDCVALKHAFLHLSVAQREGGELVAPLKELSDSTQLYYQDVVEEEIAKMPVKATLPLLCTFAGLIVCFISSPLIQVLGMTTKAFVR